MVRLRPAVHIVILICFYPALVSAQGEPAACPPACAPAPCKKCVPVPIVLLKRDAVYDCKAVDYCLRSCGPLWYGVLGPWTKYPAPCPTCSKVCTKNILLKKAVVTEYPAYDCRVVVQPVIPCSATTPGRPPGVCAEPPTADPPALIRRPPPVLQPNTPQSVGSKVSPVSRTRER